MPFANVDGARVRWFTKDECARLLNAYPPDFRRLVRAALLTGCRYGELYRLEMGYLKLEALLGIRGVGIGAQVTSIPTSVVRRAFPRRRALWTTWKKAR
jgi:integrase